MKQVLNDVGVAPTMPLPWTGSDAEVVSSEWRRSLPVLMAPGVTLRNLRIDDAPSLLAMLSTEEVARFISPPPTTVEGFEKFIEWGLQQQAVGKFFCFGIVPAGMEHAVGIVQVRNLGESFQTAEWGFAIGSIYWGTGLFESAAHLVLDFAFGEIGVERMEARCVVENGRGSGALRKVGAIPERLLPSGLTVGPKTFDQILWAIVRDASSRTTVAGSRSETIH